MDWLEQLLGENPQMPDIFRGLFTLELARMYGRTGRLRECSVQLTAADTAFVSCGHMHGTLEVRKYQLHYGCIPSANVLQELVRITEQYCAMDCPLSVLQSAPFPLERAFDAGNHRFYVKFQDVLNNICTVAEIIHERLFLHLQLLASMNAGTGHYAQVMELGRALYNDFCARKWWTPAFYTTVVLSLAESTMGNYLPAQQWASTGLKLCKKRCLEAESQAEYHLAQIRSVEPVAHGPSKAARLQEIISVIEPLVEADVKEGKKQRACTELCLMATMQFQLARLRGIGEDEVLVKAHESLDLISTLCKNLEARERASLTGQCQEMRITQLLFEGKPKADTWQEERAIRIADDLIELYHSNGLQMLEANKYRMRAMCHVQIWQKKALPNCLVAAEKDLQAACAKFQVISSSEAWLGSQHELARIYVTAFDLYKIPLDSVLVELGKLESIADTIRRELSALNGLPALLQKQKFAATTSLVDLYQWASGVNLQEHRYSELWSWSQKRKARSLSDMLGLGVIMPSTVKEGMSADPQTALGFQKLLAAQSRLAMTSQNERAFVREEIANLEEQLRPNPQFRDYLFLRDGNFGRLDGINALRSSDISSREARAIVFVDWILYKDEISMIVVKNSLQNESIRFLPLGISVSEVKNWIRQNFSEDSQRRECLKEDDLQDQYCPMRQIDGLISGLQQFTEPTDLLIFSASGCLNLLPLHALKILDERCGSAVPLISRNPIVYAPSMSVLQLCLARSRAERSSGPAVFVGVYDRLNEAAMIYSQMEQLAAFVGGKAACGADVTTKTLGTLVDGARLVHYHGHCIFSAENILGQSLVLSNGHESGDKMTEPNLSAMTEASQPKMLHTRQDNTQQRDQPSSIALGNVTDVNFQSAMGDVQQHSLLQLDDAAQSSRFTVEDIFTLSLSSYPLVTLIACESAAQTIATGDEPLGILAGLLCAGASSVVGASWPIPSRTGRMFSDAFYRELGVSTPAGASEQSEDRIRDIAVALQRAVLHLRNQKDTSETYHWGAFLLWGSWLGQV